MIMYVLNVVNEKLTIDESCNSITDSSGNEIKLRYKESSLLMLLIKRYPNNVSRKEIAEEVWAGTYVFDETINQTIKNLRNALKDKKKDIISTVPRFGYKLTVEPYTFNKSRFGSNSMLNKNFKKVRVYSYEDVLRTSTGRST
ncbi:MAG: winged helix-turn-helix domain-containing protein [Vibrio sp.]|uniref:winged helix-turn-helix domain-containing protein n=1 Tax=Vibrio TaxID=662 RepID=UPI00140D9FF8|nr:MULTISPECIES: winged helix-turn-helix domain-containing protein [unclassified Vibrio]QIL85654.1 transcriptional regulator [Vibrio sp. HDW18]